MSQFVAIRSLSRNKQIRLPGVLGTPAGPAVTPVASGGTFASATYFWKIVAVDSSGGVSLPSTEVTAAVVLNGSANLSWTAVPGAVSYQVWRGTSSNGENKFQTSTTNSFTDTGAAGTTATIPSAPTGTFQTEASTTVDTLVDLDVASVRRALSHHSAIGQYVVVASNISYGAVGSKVNLPANA